MACIFDDVFTSSWRRFSLPRRIIINFTDGPGKLPCKNHRIKPILKGAINVVAPPFVALLPDALNVQGILSIDFITALIAVVILFFIKIPQPDIIEDQGWITFSSLIKDIKAGFLYILHWKGLVALIALAIVIKIALSPAFSLFPLLVSKHFLGDYPDMV